MAQKSRRKARTGLLGNFGIALEKAVGNVLGIRVEIALKKSWELVEKVPKPLVDEKKALK